MKLRMAVGALVALLIATGSYAVVASVRTNDATPVTRDPRDDTASDRDGNAVVNLAECLGADELLAGDDALADEGAASKVPGRVEIRRIIRAVERIRKLEFKYSVDARFLSRRALAKRAADLLLSDYPKKEADTEARMLETLGAIPFDSNLRSMTRDLLESQVAGFYVPKTNKLYVPGSPDRPMGAIGRTIMPTSCSTPCPISGSESRYPTTRRRAKSTKASRCSRLSKAMRRLPCSATRSPRSQSRSNCRC